MPFTVTHVLAVVPIASVRRQPMPVSALVIGSMIPDMPMFVPNRIGLAYHSAHSTPGLFTVCLPLGLIWFVAFHTLMKRPLFALLPEAVQERCASLAAAKLEPSLRTIFWAGLAVVIGAATHVLWDSFGHAHQWGTRMLPWLNNPALTIGSHGLPGYKLIQYGSSLIGLPLLGVLSVRTLRRRPIEPVDGLPRLSPAGRVRAYACIGLIPFIVALATASVHGLSTYHRVGWTITRSGGVLIAATLAYCVAFQIMKRRLAQGFSQ